MLSGELRIASTYLAGVSILCQDLKIIPYTRYNVVGTTVKINQNVPVSAALQRPAATESARMLPCRLAAPRLSRLIVDLHKRRLGLAAVQNTTAAYTEEPKLLLSLSMNDCPVVEGTLKIASIFITGSMNGNFNLTAIVIC